MASAQEQLLDYLRRAREDSEFDDHHTNAVISSVKAQEATYDILSKQLEQERQELAAQLEQVQIGSETASLNSISESDAASSSGGLGGVIQHNFQYKAHVKIDDYSDTESRASTAQPPLNSNSLPPPTNYQQPSSNFWQQTGPEVDAPVPLPHNQVHPSHNRPQPRGSTDVGDQTDSGPYFPGAPVAASNNINNISSVPNRRPIGQLTPRSQRKGPQYNFGPVPVPSTHLESAVQPVESRREAFFEEPDMRAARMATSYSMPMDAVPARPELPAVYANGMFGHDDQESERGHGPQSSGQYGSQFPLQNGTAPMHPQYHPQTEEDSPGLYESAPNSPLHLPHRTEGYYSPNQQMHRPRHPLRDGSDALHFDGGGGGNVRSPHHSVSSSDPRSPGVARTPGVASYEPDNHSIASSTTAPGLGGIRGNSGTGNPALHNPNNSDLRIYSNSSSNGALLSPPPARQPLGSQSSNGRVPLNSSKGDPQVNYNPQNSNNFSSSSNNLNHQHASMSLQPPNSISIDAPSYGQKFPSSSGQPSPSIASRSHFPPPSVINTPGSPGALDSDEEIMRRNQRWRNPTLKEVLEYLEHRDPRVVFNAAAYLQHLTFDDQAIKKTVRELHGIPIVTRMIETAAPDLKKNLLGILRNISYGKGTIENKYAMMQCGCVLHLAKVLKTATDPEIQELSCAILWNLSSESEIKVTIMKEVMPVIVSNVIVPESGWLEFENQYESHLITPMPKPLQSPPGAKIPEWSLLFRNATGCLRNLSSGDDARRKLREVPHLIDSLIHVLNVAIVKNDVNGRAVENCICIIRNLTFHLDSELSTADDPRYTSAFDEWNGGNDRRGDRNRSRGSLGASRTRSKSWSLVSKVTKKNKEAEQFKMPDIPETSPHARGVEILWQPLMVNICVTLMRESSDPDTLEAAAGTLQNMCAGEFFWSSKLRFVVRRRMGLPVLRELLVTFENDVVIATVAGALRNVCVDKENKRLIGLHATAELVKHLPSENEKDYRGILWDKVGYILLTLAQICRGDEENCRHVLQCDGLYRIIPLAKYRSKDKMVVPPRIVKLAETLLTAMWDMSRMRSEYKEHGFIKEHFDPTAIVGIKKKYEAVTLTRRGKAKSVDDLNSGGYGTGASRRTAARSTLNTSREGTSPAAPSAATPESLTRGTNNRQHNYYPSNPNSPGGYNTSGHDNGVTVDNINDNNARSQSVDIDHFAHMDLNQQHGYGYDSRTDGLDPYSMQQSGYPAAANYDQSYNSHVGSSSFARNQLHQPSSFSSSASYQHHHQSNPVHAPDSHVYSSSSLRYYHQPMAQLPPPDLHFCDYVVDKSSSHHGGGFSVHQQERSHLPAPSYNTYNHPSSQGMGVGGPGSYSSSPRHHQQQFLHQDPNSSQANALDTNGHTWL